jgi:hypothetical protein
MGEPLLGGFVQRGEGRLSHFCFQLPLRCLGRSPAPTRSSNTIPSTGSRGAFSSAWTLRESCGCGKGHAGATNASQRLSPHWERRFKPSAAKGKVIRSTHGQMGSAHHSRRRPQNSRRRAMRRRLTNHRRRNERPPQALDQQPKIRASPFERNSQLSHLRALSSGERSKHRRALPKRTSSRSAKHPSRDTI